MWTRECNDVASRIAFYTAPIVPSLRCINCFSARVRHLMLWHPRRSGGSRDAARIHHTSRRRGGWVAALLQMALIEMNKVEAFGPDGSHPALAIALA